MNWLKGYNRRREVSINHKMIEKDTENFEVLSTLPEREHGGYGEDIAFTDAEGNLLPDFVCFIDSHGRVDYKGHCAVSSTKDTVFYVYWNDAEIEGIEE